MINCCINFPFSFDFLSLCFFIVMFCDKKENKTSQRRVKEEEMKKGEGR